MAALWAEAFGEGDPYCTSFFRHHFSEEASLVALEGGKLTAMLHTVRTTLFGVPARYLYAVATAKEYRGRGIFTALHRTLEAQAEEPCFFLIPEGESLFGFYERFGYRTRGFAPALEAGGCPLSKEEAYLLYRERADALAVPLRKEEFFTTAQDKRFFKGTDACPFVMECPDGTCTSFFGTVEEGMSPVCMVYIRSGKDVLNFVLPRFLN